MSKGSKTRPTNKVEYDRNYDTIFGRKYVQPELPEPTYCTLCGDLVPYPCEDFMTDACVEAKGR